MEKITCVKKWKKLDAYLEPNIYGALLRKSLPTKSCLLFSQKKLHHRCLTGSSNLLIPKIRSSCQQNFCKILSMNIPEHSQKEY